MNPGLAVISNVAEVFSIGGLTVGIVLLLAALLAALLDLGWVATRAAVEHDEHGPLVRWFGDDGRVYAHGLTGAQFAQISRLAGGSADWATIYVRRGKAGRMRLERSSAAVRTLRLLGGIVTGVGLVGLVASIVVMFAAA